LALRALEPGRNAAANRVPTFLSNPRDAGSTLSRSDD
jgi:hypothetical protein